MKLQSYTPDVIAGIIVFAMVCLLVWACTGCSTPDQDLLTNKKAAKETANGLEQNPELALRVAHAVQPYIEFPPTPSFAELFAASCVDTTRTFVTDNWGKILMGAMMAYAVKRFRKLESGLSQQAKRNREATA